MTGAISVRAAGPPDAAWINTRYDEVGFAPSTVSAETIAIAEVGARRAGLGRLVPLGGGEGELGGILVLPEYRRRGLAGRIVEFLLERCSPFERVFCLPFAHLSQFYEGYGFRFPEHGCAEIPEQVRRKHEWCNRTYEHETLLLVLSRAAAG